MWLKELCEGAIHLCVCVCVCVRLWAAVSMLTAMLTDNCTCTAHPSFRGSELSLEINQEKTDGFLIWPTKTHMWFGVNKSVNMMSNIWI